MGHSGGRGLQNLRPVVCTEQPPEQKRAQSDRDHSVAEASCHPVCQTLNRGTSGLSLFHQPDDPGKSRFGSNPRHFEQQRSLEIETSGRQLSSRFSLEREWFTGEA